MYVRTLMMMLKVASRLATTPTLRYLGLAWLRAQEVGRSSILLSFSSFPSFLPFLPFLSFLPFPSFLSFFPSFFFSTKPQHYSPNGKGRVFWDLDLGMLRDFFFFFFFFGKLFVFCFHSIDRDETGRDETESLIHGYGYWIKYKHNGRTVYEDAPS